MLGTHDSISLPQSTEYAKEMSKWEAYPTKFGPAGRPYQFREFPKRMYRAEYTPGKGTEIVEAHTVNNADEERNMRSRGFYFGPQEAFDAVRDQQTEFGTLAAKREFQIQHNRISEKATAEVRAAEEAHGTQHLPDVPETPIPAHRKKGWPKGKSRKTAEEPVSA